MRRWKQQVALPLLLTAALVGAACGTTLESSAGDERSGRAIAEPGAVETTVAGPMDPGGPDGGPGGAGPASPAEAGGQGNAGRSAGGADAQTPAGTGGAAPLVRASQGVTASTITLGVFVFDWGGLKNMRGFNQGDPRVQARAVADHINANGGITGRELQLVFAGYGVTSSNWAAEEQAVCTAFSQDHKVFAVIYPLLGTSDVLVPCLAKNNTPVISPGGGQEDRQSMAAFGDFLYYSGSMTVSRLANAYVEGLVAQGFLTKSSKIGLVRPDQAPFERATDQVLEARLSAHGMSLTEEAVVQANRSVSDTAAQMPNIVLRFQQKEIDRVLFLDNGTLGSLFVSQAASQGYNPKYGFNSLSNPNFMVNNAPASALVGSMGVGFQSALDVVAAQEGGLTGATRTCGEIMAAAGQGDVDRIGVWGQRMYCDGMFFLKAALDGTSDMTPAGLRERVEGLASSYDSAQTFSTLFGPGRKDGASSVRYFAYDTGCSCYRYTTGGVSIP